MALVVQKFGGTSVRNTERIENVAKRVIETKKAGNRVVVVVSALGGATDDLVSLASQITDSPSEREMDMLLATGEQVSVALLAMAIHKRGHKAVSFTGPQVGILTSKSHTCARIEAINTDRIRKALRSGNIVIAAGFQGQTIDQEITTLGRGGSDLTAVALATALKASVCEIYTDVDGIYTADPRLIKDARKLDVISYDEMLEMAALGAQVMQARSIEVGKKYNIPIRVRSSLNRSKGTLIQKEVKSMEDVMVRGVALNNKEAKVTLFDVPDKPGVASQIFKTLADQNVNVDMIIQNKTATRKTDLSFTVYKHDIKKAVATMKKTMTKIGGGKLVCDENISKISVVGVGMRSHSGVASKMFGALARNKVNIEMISTSEIKISCVVASKSGQKALKAIHREFKLGKGQRGSGKN